ncbi:hypothetical protein [Defluviimonas salinarum]|uniref:Uncharacterized protein n=1 Tax=Defluviimonas salinarum TaxID=2992147 RepID=A0ABT3J5J7_9RHOB|nr:hypothetical protein [Defluviimonas salinarum]MCW3782948.1 hypothetical protein [Defluviimonas salinarum]
MGWRAVLSEEEYPAMKLCPACAKALGTSLTSCPCGWRKPTDIELASSVRREASITVALDFALDPHRARTQAAQLGLSLEVAKADVERQFGPEAAAAWQNIGFWRDEFVRLARASAGGGV